MCIAHSAARTHMCVQWVRWDLGAHYNRWPAVWPACIHSNGFDSTVVISTPARVKAIGFFDIKPRFSSSSSSSSLMVNMLFQLAVAPLCVWSREREDYECVNSFSHREKERSLDIPLYFWSCISSLVSWDIHKKGSCLSSQRMQGRLSPPESKW